MRKNILYCFGRRSDAVEAFHKATCGGKKRLNCLRIDTPEKVCFFRVVKSLDQARTLAGIAFSEVYFSGEESSEAKRFLQCLIRTPLPA